MSRVATLNTFTAAIIGVAIAFSNIGSAQLVTDGLVGYWTLDRATINGNTVADSAGDNVGELVDGPDIVPGYVGEALEFDGVNAVSIIGTPSLSFVGAEEFTAAAWINPGEDVPVGSQAAAGCCGTIVGQRNASGWALRFDGRNPGQELEFIVNNGAWAGDGGFGHAATVPGEWHYIMGVYSGDGMRFYFDGELVKEGPGGAGVTSTGPGTEIGRASDGAWIGIIDEVTIYNRALDDDDAQANFLAKGLTVDPVGKTAMIWGELKSAR